MLVRDVMTEPAITICSRATVKDGLRELDRHHVTALPVVAGDGTLLGIVSEADLLQESVPHDARTHMIPHEEAEQPPRRIEDVMSTMSLTVGPDSDLSDAVDLMTSTAVKSLPVLEEGRVVGVVSRSDVVHLLARSDEQIHAEIDELLRSAGVECDLEVDGGHVRLLGLADPHRSRVAEVVAGSVPGVMSVRVAARRRRS